MLVTFKTCQKCKARLKRSEQFDAYYCPKCREWKEKKCGDRKCWYCKGRPGRPYA